MARRCRITGKGVQTGDNVSHTNNKTRRCFLPDMQVSSFMSDILGEPFRLRLYVRYSCNRTGGSDNYIMTTQRSKFSKEALVIRRLEKAATAV